MVVGMSGLLTLAQAVFYGIGAYATALGMTINVILAYVVGKI